MLEKLLRIFIKCLEHLLMLSIYVFYLFMGVECILKTNLIILPFAAYILGLSVYYYTKLLKKSPGSLVEFSGLEIRGICSRCNRLESNRTFHCEACNKCYYKRDHHCPWVGKCIASGNYKEFYLFVSFLLLSLIIRFVKRTGFQQANFFYNALLIVMILFYIWINFLLCIDRTALEYHKSNNNSNTNFIKYRTSWSKMEYENFKMRLSEVLLENDKSNGILIFFPFLYKKTTVIED